MNKYEKLENLEIPEHMRENAKNEVSLQLKEASINLKQAKIEKLDKELEALNTKTSVRIGITEISYKEITKYFHKRFNKLGVYKLDILNSVYQFHEERILNKMIDGIFYCYDSNRQYNLRKASVLKSAFEYMINQMFENCLTYYNAHPLEIEKLPKSTKRAVKYYIKRENKFNLYDLTVELRESEKQLAYTLKVLMNHSFETKKKHFDYIREEHQLREKIYLLKIKIGVK